jgi:hypothetical protein
MKQPPPNTEEAHLLLPWYITGKLSEPEKQHVESALASDPDLQADYQREQRMASMIRENASLLELAAVDTTDQRLDKLLKHIERETGKAQTQPEQRRPAPAKPPLLQRLREWFNFPWLPSANVAFASLLAIQIGVAGWFTYLNATKQETIYTSAAVVEDNAAASKPSGMTLLIDFKDDAAARQIREFLLKWNAHIIDGPDANNLFRIEVRDTPATDKRSELILQKMQQDQSVSNFIGREF